MADGIRGRTARECFDVFVDHLNPLIQATLPTKVPLEVVLLDDQPATAALGFRGTHTIPLPTRHGKVYFHIAQSLACIEHKKQPAGRRFRLSTRQYWYRLQLDDGQSDALLRWEYLSPTLPVYKDHGKRWCWRHIQMPHVASMPQGALDFNKIHMPSGYVVIEDVIRFLITDLGVKPPCGNTKWHQKLVDSETKFFREFNARA